MGSLIETILGGASALLYTCGCTTPERVAGNDVFAIGLQHATPLTHLVLLLLVNRTFRSRCSHALDTDDLQAA